MSDFEELRKRVQAAEQQFAAIAQQRRDYGQRLMDMIALHERNLAQTESRMAALRAEAEEARALARQREEELQRVSGENEQLRQMLHSLLRAIESGRSNEFDDTMRELDRRISAMVEAQSDSAGSQDAAAPREAAPEPPQPTPEPPQPAPEAGVMADFPVEAIRRTARRELEELEALEALEAEALGEAEQTSEVQDGPETAGIGYPGIEPESVAAPGAHGEGRSVPDVPVAAPEDKRARDPASGFAAEQAGRYPDEDLELLAFDEEEADERAGDPAGGQGAIGGTGSGNGRQGPRDPFGLMDDAELRQRISDRLFGDDQYDEDEAAPAAASPGRKAATGFGDGDGEFDLSDLDLGGEIEAAPEAVEVEEAAPAPVTGGAASGWDEGEEDEDPFRFVDEPRPGTGRPGTAAAERDAALAELDAVLADQDIDFEVDGGFAPDEAGWPERSPQPRPAAAAEAPQRRVAPALRDDLDAATREELLELLRMHQARSGREGGGPRQ